MVKLATKDPSKKEEEEVERNVRKSPSEKAPRPDKERRRIEVEDSDTDGDDPDMSMNYKDIGGSIILAKWVASSYMQKVAVEFPTETAFETYMEDHPDADPTNHTIDGVSTEEVLDLGDNKKPKSEPKPKPKSKAEQDEEVQEVVERVQGMDMDALYDTAQEGSPEEQAAAQEVLEQRRKPLPPGIPSPSEFTGELSNSSVDALKSQIKHWDAMDYSQNMFELETDMVMAQRAGNERDADYFKSVMDVYEDSSDAVRTTNLREVESPEELLEDIDDPDASAEGMDPKNLQKARKKWYQGAMFSPLNTVGGLLSDVEEMLETVKPGSQKEAYLKEMSSVMTEVRDRKMFNKDSAADRLLIGVRDSDSPDLKELDPGNFDFTDPNDVDNFMSKVQKLDTADIARMVKDEPNYRMYFSFSAGDDPDEVSISERQRTGFMESLRQDLSIRGTFEQVRFHDEGMNGLLDDGKILEYRDKAVRELQELGVDLSDPGKSNRVKSFWDTFMDWVDDTSAKLSSVEHGMSNAKAVQTGIVAAFQKKGLNKRLQGPLDLDDPQKPPVTKWRLPNNLDNDDYASILKEASRWLEESFLRHRVVDHDYEMACRIALDYSIHTASDFKYSGAVGVAEYDILLDLLTEASQSLR